MSALFERLAAVSRRAVETVTGEPVTVLPMGRPNGPNAPRAADSARPAYDTVAVFYQDSLAGMSPSPDPRPDVRPVDRSLNRSAPVTASLRLPIGATLKAQDLIVRGDGRRYEVLTINPDGLGGALLTLAVARSAEPEDA